MSDRPRDIWFTSDTHFNHKNILTFKDGDDKLTRPEFNSVNHMNEVLIDNWNRVVKPTDKVYHLGDVYFGNKEEADAILSRLNGKKRLILGNHDDVKKGPLAKHFQKILLWRSFDVEDFVVTHIPLREDMIRGNRFMNVHGHLHQNLMKSKRHMNVCVEHTNYTPIHIDVLASRIKKIKDNFDMSKVRNDRKKY